LELAIPYCSELSEQPDIDRVRGESENFDLIKKIGNLF